MHPVSTYEVHRRDQADLLQRLALLRRRELATGPTDDAPGRPPERGRSRSGLPDAATAALWAPTTGLMAP